MVYVICNYRPRSEASEGYVFTGICLSKSVGGGGVGVTPNATWDQVRMSTPSPRTRSECLPLPPQDQVRMSTPSPPGLGQNMLPPSLPLDQVRMSTPSPPPGLGQNIYPLPPSGPGQNVYPLPPGPAQNVYPPPGTRSEHLPPPPSPWDPLYQKNVISNRKWFISSVITARIAKRAKVMFSQSSVCPSPVGGVG